MSEITQELYTFPATILDSEARQHPALEGIEEPFVRLAEISSNRLDSYFTRMDPATTLRNYATEAAEGVSVLDSHEARRLGVGYSFTGRTETAEDGATTVLSDWYTIPGIRFGSTHSFATTDDYMRAVEARIIRKISVGFYGGRQICDICKQNYYSWDCPHIAGFEYEIEDENGRRDVVATATIFDARLAEFSLVYQGSTPGAALRKMEREITEGRLTAEGIAMLESRYRIRLPEPPVKVATTREIDPDETLIDAAEEPQEAAGDREHNEGDLHMELEQEIREILTAAGVSESVPVPGGVRQVLADLNAAEDRLAELDQALEGSGAPDGQEPVRWLVGEIGRLRPLADDGRAYRADLINEALAEGVRAIGETFNQEGYRGLLEASGLDVIKQMRDDWRALGDRRFTGGRQSDDGEQEPVDEVVAEPDEAYAV